MVDLAMHLMDIAQNSIRAEAKTIEIDFVEDLSNNTLLFSVKDNGVGMSSETVKRLSDPFFTTRTTRRVGLGIPFLKMSSEQTGGCLKIDSKEGVGTTIEAVYKTNNPDCLPLGDVAGYVTLLLKANPDIHFVFRYQLDKSEFVLDSEELKIQRIDVNLAEMMFAVKEYINENLKEIFKNRPPESFLC